MSRLPDGVKEDLQEVSARTAAAIKINKRGVWVAVIALGLIGYFRHDELKWWLGFGILWQLYGIGCQMDYAFHQRERSEILMREILAKLHRIKPDGLE